MYIGALELWSFLLVFARVTALFVSMPVLGNQSIPATAKIGLAAIISLALRVVIAPSIHNIPPNIVSLLLQILSETAVGLLLGMLVQLIFLSLQIAGGFSDTEMGLGIINILDPMSQQQTSLTGQFMYQLGMTLFLILGGHLWMIQVLYSSYQIVPAASAHFSGDFSGVMIQAVGQMFLLAFRIAAPLACLMLILDISFAIIARAVPQMNVFIVGMPLKLLLGIMTIAIILPMVAMVVGQFVPVINDNAGVLLKAMR